MCLCRLQSTPKQALTDKQMQIWVCVPFNAQCITCLWVCNLCVRHLGLNRKMHIILSSDKLMLVLSSRQRSFSGLFSLWKHLLLLLRYVRYSRCVLSNALDKQLCFLTGYCATQCCAVVFHCCTVLTNVRTTKRGILCTCRGCTCSHYNLSVCFSLLFGTPFLLLDIIDLSCVGVHILQVQQLASLQNEISDKAQFTNGPMLLRHYHLDCTALALFVACI